MPIKTFTIQNEYPISGARFVDESTVLVTGGIPDQVNKITAFKINFKRKTKKIKKFRELVLPEIFPPPSSLDTNGEGIIVSFNEDVFNEDDYSNFPPFSNLRKYNWINEHLVFQQPANLAGPDNSFDICCISDDCSIAAGVTSSGIVLFDPVSLKSKFLHQLTSDANDVHISPDGKILCYITDNMLKAISTVTGRVLVSFDKFSGVRRLNQLRFVTNDEILVAGGSTSSGLVLCVFSIAKLKIVKTHSISSKARNITSLDYCPVIDPISKKFDPKNAMIAISDDTSSISIFKFTNFKKIAVFDKSKNEMVGGIAKVTFSPTGEYLAAVSESVFVVHIPLDEIINGGSSFFASAFYSVFCLILVAIVGLVIQYVINKRVFDHLVEQIKKNRTDSSQYFTISEANEVKSQSSSKREPSEKHPMSIIQEIVYDDIMSSSIVVLNSEAATVSIPSKSETREVIERSVVAKVEPVTRTSRGIVEVNSETVAPKLIVEVPSKREASQILTDPSFNESLVPEIPSELSFEVSSETSSELSSTETEHTSEPSQGSETMDIFASLASAEASASSAAIEASRSVSLSLASVSASLASVSSSLASVASVASESARLSSIASESSRLAYESSVSASLASESSKSASIASEASLSSSLASVSSSLASEKSVSSSLAMVSASLASESSIAASLASESSVSASLASESSASASLASESSASASLASESSVSASLASESSASASLASVSSSLASESSVSASLASESSKLAAESSASESSRLASISSESSRLASISSESSRLASEASVSFSIASESSVSASLASESSVSASLASASSLASVSSEMAASSSLASESSVSASLASVSSSSASAAASEMPDLLEPENINRPLETQYEAIKREITESTEERTVDGASSEVVTGSKTVEPESNEVESDETVIVEHAEATSTTEPEPDKTSESAESVEQSTESSIIEITEPTDIEERNENFKPAESVEESNEVTESTEKVERSKTTEQVVTTELVTPTEIVEESIETRFVIESTSTEPTETPFTESIETVELFESSPATPEESTETSTENEESRASSETIEYTESSTEDEVDPAILAFFQESQTYESDISHKTESNPLHDEL